MNLPAVQELGALGRVLRHAAIVGVADHRAMYTWRTWTFGWFVRVLGELSFFGLIGRLLESRATVAFLVVGNSVLMATAVTMLAVQSTTWERMAGTLSLLVASPTPASVVFLGRSVAWVPNALASSFGGLVLVSLVFQLDLPLGGLLWTLPLLVVCIVGTYGLATFVGALVLRTISARNLASNLVRYVMTVVIGANVPVSFFPAWVGWLSTAFPATFALRAVREVLAGASIGATLPDVGCCLLVGMMWLVLAVLAFEHFSNRGRADGTIEFGGP